MTVLLPPPSRTASLVRSSQSSLGWQRLMRKLPPSWKQVSYMLVARLILSMVGVAEIVQIAALSPGKVALLACLSSAFSFTTIALIATSNSRRHLFIPYVVSDVLGTVLGVMIGGRL